MIFDEIHTSFPFYDDILKQNRHKKNCENQCNYRLIFPYNTIIPFQFAIPQKDPSDYAVIDSCYVKCSDDDSIILDLVAFLNGSFDTIMQRMQERTDHYMPASLLQSQFDALEIPGDAIQIDIKLPPEKIIGVIISAI